MLEKFFIVPLQVWQHARGEHSQPTNIIQVEPLKHNFSGPRIFVGMDLLDNHIGRPSEGTSAGFQNPSYSSLSRGTRWISMSELMRSTRLMMDPRMSSSQRLRAG